MKHRWVGIGATVVVGLLLVGLVVHVYITAYGTGDPRSERPAAMKAARHQEANVRGKLLVAAYVPNVGSHQPGNTRHSCFGRTVEVRMIWRNSDITTTGDTAQPITGDLSGVVLTVDATSGTVCHDSVVFEQAVDLPAGSIYLFGPREDMVPASG